LTSPKTVVEQFLDAARRHDLDGMLSVLADDAYFVPSGQRFGPSYGDFSGHEGWRKWWAVSRGEELSLDVLAVEQLHSDRVLAELLVGETTRDGYESVVRVGVYTVRDGKVAAIEIFTNRDLAYERVRSRSPGGADY
jgi:ketosteroid isomerase-like protein